MTMVTVHGESALDAAVDRRLFVFSALPRHQSLNDFPAVPAVYERSVTPSKRSPLFAIYTRFPVPTRPPSSHRTRIHQESQDSASLRVALFACTCDYCVASP